jgi:hypothetical protein
MLKGQNYIVPKPVLVNNSGHFNLLIAHTESATNHHWMSEVDPGCNISYRQPHHASYGCGLAGGF